ncbi:O-acyltransferase like protein [Rhinoraja longicauda]
MLALWIYFMLSLAQCRTLHQNLSSKCLEDSIEFLEELQSETPEEYALLMYDSLGKEGSNILHGNVDQLGSYSECTSARASSGNFNGQYCKFTILQGKIEYTVAICVPSSCKKDDILMLEWLEIFMYKNKPFIAPSPILSFIEANATYRVKSVHCQNNIPYIDVFVGICIFVVALFITMMIAGSIYVTIKEWKNPGKIMEDDLSPAHKNYKTVSFHEINGQQLQESIAISMHESSGHGVTEGKNNKVGFLEWMLTSFAIQKSVPAVLSTQITAGSYSAIHGIRALSLLWIISGHVCHFSLLNNLDNPIQWLLSVPNNVLYIFSLGGPFYLAVDTFFLLSGLLSARTLLNMHYQPDQGLTIKCIDYKTVKDYVINRLQRILPLYIYTMCLYIGMYSLIPWKSLGEYPKSHLDKCRRSWWTNLLFINNFILIDQQCMGWTWYLANDFQFHITTPLFIFLLFRLLSQSDYSTQYYTKPYCRYGPFLIGIMLGILLHHRKTSLLTKTSVLTGWLCSLITMAAVIALGYTLDDSVESYSAPPVLYQALHRTAWAAAVGWIILVCEEGYAGFVNTLLSSKLWIPVANLSYACFLIHPAVIDMYYGLQETLLHYTDINMFYLFLGHTVLTHIIGFALCILIENPMQTLRKYFR